jgi:hypothetical protein
MSKQLSTELTDLASAARVQDLEPARLGVQRILAALRNRAYCDGLTSGTLTAPTIATPSVYAIALLTAKTSGIFQVAASGTATAGAVEAGGVSVALVAFTPATAGATISIAHGTPAPGQNGVIYFVSGSAITVAASTGSLTANTLAQNNGLNNLASSATSMPFALCGDFGQGTGLPVTVGSQVAFALCGQVGTTTLELANFNLSVNELP